jgi:membrane associated rhomboid family serine protease
MVKKLLFANFGVFLIASFLPSRFVLEWLAFRPDHVLTRPWGALTYMFVHAGLMHVLFNMLVVFFFGPPLEERWGSNEFIRYYLLCGFGGVLLSFLLSSSAPIVGASAACYGLMLAFAMNWPDSPIYIWGIFPVQAKWLVGLLFLITLLNAFGAPKGTVAHMAHLGGIVAGLIYLKADWRPREKLTSLRQRMARARRLAIVPRDEEAPPAALRSGGWPSTEEDVLLDAVDRVLDKISAEGITALTPEERSLLDEVSRRNRPMG